MPQKCSDTKIYQRAMWCMGGDHAIHRHGPDEPWVNTSMIGGYDSAECTGPGHEDDKELQFHAPGAGLPTPVNPNWDNHEQR